jgi:hypothetical protein
VLFRAKPARSAITFSLGIAGTLAQLSKRKMMIIAAAFFAIAGSEGGERSAYGEYRSARKMSIAAIAA